MGMEIHCQIMVGLEGQAEWFVGMFWTCLPLGSMSPLSFWRLLALSGLTGIIARKMLSGQGRCLLRR